MANQARRLVIEILGDARDFARAGAETESTLDRVGRRSQVAGAAMFAAGGVMAAGLLSAARAAAEDEQAQATLARTLQNTTGATNAQVAAVEDFITEQQNATGVLDDELRPAMDRLVRSTGDIAEAQQLMTLAMDISAGTGRDLESVANALGRAHDGNVAGLGRLGIATRDASGQTMDFAGVMAAAQETFGGQAAAAADTTAGRLAILNARMENLKEEIGTAVIPVMEDLIGVVGGAAEWFTNLNEETDGAVGKITIGTTAFLLFGGAVTTVVGKLITMRDTLQAVRNSRVADWANENKVAIGGLAAVVGTATLAWQQYEQRQANAEARTQSFTDALRSEEGAATGMVAALEPIIADTDVLREAMVDAGVTSAELASALLNQGDEWSNLRERLIEASDGGFRLMDIVLDQTQDSMRGARDRAADLAVVVDQVGGSAGRARPQIADLGDSTADTATPVADLRDRFREVIQGLEDWQAAVDDWLGNSLAYNDQLRATNDAVSTYLAAEGDLNDIFSDRSAAADDVIGSIVATAQAYADSKGAVDGSRESIDLQLDALRTMRSFIPAELLPTIDDYIARLQAIPTSLDVNINQMVRTFEGAGTVSSGGPLRAPRAAGGPVLPGGSYLVGESGPEYLTMGNASGYVTPAGGGGGGPAQQIVIQLDGRTIGEALVRASRNGGPVVVSTR